MKPDLINAITVTLIFLANIALTCEELLKVWKIIQFLHRDS